MSGFAALETALGAELLRARMLGWAPVQLGGRYTLEGFLGRGGGGVVVSATDDRLSRAVALKLTLVGAEGFDLVEARALARLDHPNVVRVFDTDEIETVLDGVPFRLRIVAMQRVAGPSLRQWLAAERRLPTEITAVFKAAAAGLAAAHAARVIHRDFKPDNVVLTANGVPQVIDFGLAASWRTSHSGAEVRSETIVGTDPYIAPEARGGLWTAKSDQYAFGIALVEALTGEPSQPAPDAPPAVPVQLWRAVRRACALDPADRFDDMTALSKALEVAPRRFAGRRPLLALSGIAFALVAGLGLTRRERDEVPGGTVATTCRDVARRWEFETVVERRLSPNALPVGTWGVYTLVLHDGTTCEREVEVERRCDQDAPAGYGSKRPRHQGPATFTVDGSSVRAVVEGVRFGSKSFVYSFQLERAGDAMSGRAEARDGNGSGYDLRVERVSHSKCLAGPDR